MTKQIPLSFEDYLMDVHAEQYRGLDDDMPDDFSDWLGDLDGDDYIRYGEQLYNLLTKTK